MILATAVLLLEVFFAPAQAKASKTPEELSQLYARSAVLMDADSGRVLFGKEEKTVRPMASTTKIMTCILVLESDMEEICTASDHATSQPQVRLGVKEGEQYFTEDLLYSLMLESHNDSAVVLAENQAGTVEAFADQMNKKAKEIGCKNTHFVTPNGLDGKDEEDIHGTTAADLARIMRYCIKISPERERFLEITRTKSYQFTDVSGSRSFSCSNHNTFLDMMEGALTGKTGFTADAGYCYVGALRKDDRTFIVALLACGWPNNKNYKWSDTKKLMQYGIDNYQYEKIERADTLPDLPVRNGVPDSGVGRDSRVSLSVKGNSRLFLMAEDEKVETVVTLPDYIEAPVEKGETVGKIRYIVDDFVVSGDEIYAAEPILKRDFFWCFTKITELFCVI